MPRERLEVANMLRDTVAFLFLRVPLFGGFQGRPKESRHFGGSDHPFSAAQLTQFLSFMKPAVLGSQIWDGLGSDSRHHSRALGDLPKSLRPHSLAERPPSKWCGSKLKSQTYAGISSCFHTPRWHLGYAFGATAK